jgi:hypothetical protein
MFKPFPKSGKSTKKKSDAKLWKAFSLFIRLRDSDDNGYGACFTCKKVIRWKDGDCGHGVGRQHWGTRYNERNNHLQCKGCNGFQEGRKDLYAVEMDKRYGAGTWDLMNASKNGKKYTETEIEILTKHYTEKYKELAKQKGIEI